MSDQKIIFSMVNVSKTFAGGKQVLKNIHLSFFYGAKIGVLGLNGAGKSTLLKLIAGLDRDYHGEISSNSNTSFGYLPQEPQLDAEKTVRQIVEEGASDVVGLIKQFEAVSEKMADPDADFDALLTEQGKLQEKIDAVNGWDIQSKLDMAMEALRCAPPDSKIATLSGGERRRVALCRILLQKPDVLLLDEPTNHLDAEAVAWLEKHLHDYEGTVIAVTHDRYFLDQVAGWILELDRGEGIPFKGNYSSWLEQKNARLANQEKRESKRQKAIERELEWIKMNPKGRHAKSKARIQAYENLLQQDVQKRQEELELFIPPGPRLGDVVIEANDVSKTFGDKILFEHLTFSLPPGGIVGVIGPNGAGKTTLFKMITGQEKSDSGDFRVGPTVKIGYVDQMRPLDDSKTIWQEVSSGQETVNLGKREVNSRAYLSWFNFTGTDQQKLVSVLSGGERNRLHLAKSLLNEANVLLLDEPTNDLDVNTLRSLEEALLQYAGCAVVVSHDRWFLDRIATHILAFEGNSQVVWFDGNYTQYEEDRLRRLGTKSIVPERVKYRKLERG